MLSSRNAMMPPASIITNSTTIRTRCLRAKATTAFMAMPQSPEEWSRIVSVRVQTETARRSDVYAFYMRANRSRKWSAAGRGRRHPVDEEAAPRDHAVAGSKTVQYFHHRAVGEPDLDLAQFDRGIVVARNPHPGALALVDDGIARHRNRGFALAAEDLHAREHFRLEHTGGVVDG